MTHSSSLLMVSENTFSWPYLLLKQHGVDGLAAGQDHHGESNGHRHHEAHPDHFCHQVGWKVHEHVAGDVLREADVAEEAHLVERKAEDVVLRRVGQINGFF